MLVIALGSVALAGAFLWAFHDLPIERSASLSQKQVVFLEDSDGQPIGRVGPMKLADSERSGFPDQLVNAVLSIEDRRFYQHVGLDFAGIVRAAYRNVVSGKILEGGSTITQQLVKLQYSDNKRTFDRKIREAVTALWLEQNSTKDEILTQYLNNVYLGAGAYGVPAAAQIYFGKTPTQLTLMESATLAGLIKAPSQLNPFRDPVAARNRAEVVLDTMVENKVLDPAAAAAAKTQVIRLRTGPEATSEGSWFGDWVAREGQQMLGSSARSIRLRTTIDPRIQRLGEKAVNDILSKEGRRAHATQAALVAMRPDGAVLAMVGGRDYRESQFNRAIEANRQPGSTFKLFVYLAALRKGYTADETIDAGPIDIKGWRPENFGGRDYGDITLADAFAYSINTAAVRLATEVGLNDVIAAARDLGVTARLPALPSIALGSAEVSLLEMTGAYASIRAGRLHLRPWGISGFALNNQTALRAVGATSSAGDATLPEQQAMTDLLQQVVERGSGRRAALNGFAAGKTGTSQNHKDAWFIGFNESLVVGVWVGNDDGSPMEHVVGGSLPASIWHAFMTQASPLARMASARTGRPGQTKMPDDVSGAAASPRATLQRSLIAKNQCNYNACERSYRSFRQSDCSYQSYNGERKTCLIPTAPDDLGAGASATTGSGPARAALTVGGPESPAAMPDNATSSLSVDNGREQRRGSRVATADNTGPDRAREARRESSQEKTAGRSSVCNVSACARKYSSFDSSDCTYKPYGRSGRRLCEIGGDEKQADRAYRSRSERRQRAADGRDRDDVERLMEPGPRWRAYTAPEYDGSNIRRSRSPDFGGVW